METLSCRLLPYAVADGATNMATDEVLLNAAASGVASLRFYGWSAPTLSLGYFQCENVRHADPLLVQLPFVRRPTGGDTLVHHHELTYALAVPVGAWQVGGPWLPRMHEIISGVLASLGIRAQLFAPAASRPCPGPLCFHHFTAGDLLVGSAKVVGSAQRKRRGALLQHGGILLARSPFTPALPGIAELTGKALQPLELQAAIMEYFPTATRWRLTAADWSEIDRKAIDTLKIRRYLSAGWNRKR